MGERVNKRSGHLQILICYTIMETALILEGLLLGWNMSAAMLLLVGLITAWAIYVTEKLEAEISLWLYFILMMLAFFYYGMHATSLYDLAPTMATIILLMSGTGKRILVRLCTVTYFVTMIYALLFVAGDTIEMDSLTVTRTMLHFALVCIADWLVKAQQRERAGLQRDMDAKVSELEESNHKIENFLVNVSHELRTPINAIMGLTSVMLDRERDASKRREVLSIQKAGHRLFDQIEDILDYTEIDTGSIQINNADYMISSVINDIVIGERSREHGNHPEIIFDVDPGIPARLVGDGRKIKKIVKHLIDNAVKFTPQGAVLVEISGRRREYGVNLCIRVTDTGIGIREEDIKKLSGQFYQLNGERNRNASGLGLGLSIVYGIVSAMGGFVKIESRENEGTVVSVSIPQGVSDEARGMSVDHPGELCIACYLKPEKYASPRVFQFYDNMISHMAQGLSIPLHRAGNEAELERVLARYRVTHLFIGKEEYLDRPSYYESLWRETSVVTVTDDVGALPADSHVTALEKPFYFLPIIDILNQSGAAHAGLFDTRRFLCPGVKALIVDDEPMNLMVAEELLKSYQMRVWTADSGRKAVDICMEEEFDLIFLDHMMPEMDGVETLKLLRRRSGAGKKESNNKMAVIAFTANAVSGAREMFLREGFDEFLSKPIERLELDRVLKKVLPGTAIVYPPEEELPSDGQSSEDVLGLPESKPEPTPQQDAAGENKPPEGKEEAPEAESELAFLQDAGINTSSGLMYCAGDQGFYKTMLASFAESAPRNTADMRGFLQSGDWDNYRVLVHALKSTAKMIGADALSAMAKAAEDAAKKSDADYITAHEGELMAQYSQTVQVIADALHLAESQGGGDQAEDSPTQIPAEDFRELTGEEWKSHLLELKECLDLFEADRADSLIAEIRGAVYGGRKVEAILAGVIRDVEDFEFSAASEKTGELIGTLEGGDA